MNKFKSITISLLLIAAVSYGFSDTFTKENKDATASGLNDFASQLLYTVPSDAVQLNNWQDSFIGMLFPSMFPKIGGGFSLGVTKISTSGLKSASESISTGHQNFLSSIKSAYSLSDETKFTEINFGNIPDNYALPTAAAEIRFGGFWIPVDWGVSFATSQPSLFNLDFENFGSVNNSAKTINFEKLNFSTCFDMIDFGADMRIRLLKERLVFPSVSFGGGYHFSRGTFCLTSKDNSELSGSSLVQSTDSQINVAYTAHIAFAQLQFSKNFFFLTFYAGARGIVTKQENAWNYTYKDELSDGSSTLQVNSAEDFQTVSSGQEPVSGFIHGTFDLPGVEAQVYGGLGFNMGPVELGFGVSYGIRHQIFGANVALHLKI